MDFEDSRGTFRKLYPTVKVNKSLNFDIKQINLSKNPRLGTLRGLHSQLEPFYESKFITCLKGAIFDVVLDLRQDSPTFGKWKSFYMNSNSGSLLVPSMVAHGFQTLEADTDVLYFHNQDYVPSSSTGINPMDVALSIAWPLQVSEISEQDQNFPSFADKFKL
jgi:dTDP-4-dehydrorhamnose 3,5-epimerase